MLYSSIHMATVGVKGLMGFSVVGASLWSFVQCVIYVDCSGERQLSLQSAAKNCIQWRSSFEQVADWLASKEAIVIGLQQLSCDLERLGQQSNSCEVDSSVHCLRYRGRHWC